MVRFLHTGDWQLGMTRRFFSPGVQERFAQSRFDAIRTLYRVAKEEDCRFMVVCGDVFESNQVDRKTVARTMEALKESPVPVYLLPGNHDPLDASSVYRSPTFLERKPAHVHVIESTAPILVDQGVELVGAPWHAKRVLCDLAAEAVAPLEAKTNTLRICVAHGIVDTLSPNPDDPALISLQAAEAALAQGTIQYVALGDRHSITSVGNSGRVWYAGSPEPTDYNEIKSGFALVAEVDRDKATTREVSVGAWRFIEYPQMHVNTAEDIETLHHRLEEIADKEHSVVKLRLVGTLSLQLSARLDAELEQAEELLGALQIRRRDFAVVPEDADFNDFGLTGFAENTVQRLRALTEGTDKKSMEARDALALLVRLTGKRT